MGSTQSNTASKVVSLSGLGPSRNPGLRILGECRDQLVSSLCRWLSEVVTPISEELLFLADSTRERSLQTRYLDLRADIEKDWPHLQETFKRNLIGESEHSQQQTSHQQSNTEKPLDLPDFEGLKLVDDDDLSEHIVIREFSAQIAETCDDELYTLNRRIAVLLGQDELTDSRNPLAPSIICQALSDACTAIGSDAESRLLLLRRIERHLHRGLPPIFQQINAMLIERGILPDLKRSYRKTDVFGEKRPAGSEQTQPAQGFPHSDNAGQPRTAANAPVTNINVLEALQRLAATRSNQSTLSFAPNAQSISSVAQTDAALAGNTGAQPVAIDVNAINQLLAASLNEFQHAPQPLGNETGTIVNQIRLVRESEPAQQVGGLASVTIDIVAMLFDFVFDDSHIPLAIKALISRLQIPVLKVAMLNPGFFADRQHPTRRFLGSVSGISIRWGESVDENDPFYAKLSELVERIQNEFENDIEIFGTALTELEDFVAEREDDEDTTALAATHLVLQREREAAAQERAQRCVKEFCTTTHLPPLVAEFIGEHWRQVLCAADLSEDESEKEWQLAEQTMRDLAWSIEAKKTPDDRLKLIGLLPKLLGQINKGLDRIHAGATARQAFFDELVKHHSAALKGEMRATAPEPAKEGEKDTPIAVDFTPAGEGDILITRSIDNGIAVEEITLVGAAPLWRANDRDIFRQVCELKRGDWIEFREQAPENDGQTVCYRERLHWISPQRGILLFSNHRSASAISITQEALAKKIRDGLADIVQADEIFEKALTGALDTITT